MLFCAINPESGCLRLFAACMRNKKQVAICPIDNIMMLESKGLLPLVSYNGERSLLSLKNRNFSGEKIEFNRIDRDLQIYYSINDR